MNKTSAVISLGTGLATFFNYLPIVTGSMASLAAFVFICIQTYYFLKEKKKK